MLALLAAADALADAGIEVGPRRRPRPDRCDRRWGRRDGHPGVAGAGPGGPGPGGGQPVPAHRDAAEHAGGADRHRARHPRLQLVGRHRLRLRRPGDRRGVRLIAPARSTWCSAGPARHRCSRPSPTPSATRGPWPAAATTRPRRVGRSTPPATGSSWPRVPRAGAGTRRARRGARRAGYADVPGQGATTDAYHPTTPRPDGAGAAACMRRALRRRRCAAGDVGYVNAHGTGTKLGDIAETTALSDVFGGRRSAGQLHQGAHRSPARRLRGAGGGGHASGARRGAAAADLPPRRPRSGLRPADHIRGAPRRPTRVAVMSNSFGFGGQNVSLLLGPRRRAERGDDATPGRACRTATQGESREGRGMNILGIDHLELYVGDARQAAYLLRAPRSASGSAARVARRPGWSASARCCSATATSGCCSPPGCSADHPASQYVAAPR